MRIVHVMETGSSFQPALVSNNGYQTKAICKTSYSKSYLRPYDCPQISQNISLSQRNLPLGFKLLHWENMLINVLWTIGLQFKQIGVWMQMEANQLTDPKGDRMVRTVPPPPQRPLLSSQMFVSNKECNWKLLKDHLKRGGKIEQQEFIKLIDLTSAILKNEPNLVSLSDPVTIVGDIHGQFYDLLKVLEIGDTPDKSKYLFLGDYVDRGSYSIEVLLLIFALKVTYPEDVILLRGNHECKQMTSFFNFKSECLSKYNQDIYDRLMTLFDMLPLSCILNGKFFCVHGGLSPDLKTLDDIKKIDRFKQIPKSGIFCDLMWSDPVDNNDGHCEKIVKANDVRGCSYFFGAELCKQFLQKNKLITLIRAHQAQAQGYKFYKWINANFPTVITIFSAPNYCDVYNNKAAVIKFVKNQINVQQFNFQEHPYLLPNFLNVFSWSLPFVAEKVTEMLYHLIKPDQKIEITNNNKIIDADEVKLFETLLNMQKVQTSQNMELVSMEGATPDDKLISSGIYQSIKLDKKKSTPTTATKFEKNKGLDKRNEMRPDK